MKERNSGAILNIDNDGLDSYRKQKQAFENARTSADRLAKVENDLREIKEILREMVKR